MLMIKQITLYNSSTIQQLLTSILTALYISLQLFTSIYLSKPRNRTGPKLWAAGCVLVMYAYEVDYVLRYQLRPFQFRGSSAPPSPSLFLSLYSESCFLCRFVKYCAEICAVHALPEP